MAVQPGEATFGTRSIFWNWLSALYLTDGVLGPTLDMPAAKQTRGGGSHTCAACCHWEARVWHSTQASALLPPSFTAFSLSPERRQSPSTALSRQELRAAIWLSPGRTQEEPCSRLSAPTPLQTACVGGPSCRGKHCLPKKT